MERHSDSSSTGSVTRQIDRLTSGSLDSSDEAARQLCDRYLPRLLTIARRHLDRRIQGVHDEGDVVQSMGRSFFMRVRRGEFDLADRDALWALLVTITRRKAHNAADRHFAARRDVRRVRPLATSADSGSDALQQAFAPEDDDPTPLEADLLNEALERRLRDLEDPELRQVAMMKLEGYSNCEIGEARKWSGRTVERKLNLIRKRWEVDIEDPI